MSNTAVEIKAIFENEALKHDIKIINDELYRTIRLYAEAGVSKEVTREIVIGILNSKGLPWLCGAARVLTARVYIELRREKRREKVENLFSKVLLRKRRSNKLGSF